MIVVCCFTFSSSPLVPISAIQQMDLKMTDAFIITGPIVHSQLFGDLTVINDGYIAVKQGKIAAIGEANDVSAVQKTLLIDETKIIKLKKGQFLMPGLIDTHIHAPQFPNAGLGYDMTLMSWLDTYTFPLEAKYSDVNLAQKVYSSVVTRTLGNGTTTACYFSTIHLEGSMVLVDKVIEGGQRALVGKVNMNQNHPDYYGENTNDSVNDTNLFVTAVLEKKCPLVLPVITPRFAVSCDMPLMTTLAQIANKFDVHIQTHISESLGEIDFVNSLYPDCKNYADVYDKAGLLTKKTILAHGIHLKDDELITIENRGTSISHCPNSNTSLQSGACDVRRLLTAGIKVGLGTDVSGGYSPSILDAMRSAMSVSIHVSFAKNEDYVPLNYKESFYLGTLGGAQALGLEDVIGNFKVGKDFDALVVDINAKNSPIDGLGNYDLLEQIQKFIFLGDDRNISRVYVSGKIVK